MKSSGLLTVAIIAGLTIGAFGVVAGAPTMAAEQIYGSQMMTEQERQQYRDQMRSAESASERERIRREHHEAMKLRAKEKGITLPDEPPAQGMGRGTGMGPRGGMGPGGMGPGGMGGRGR